MSAGGSAAASAFARRSLLLAGARERLAWAGAAAAVLWVIVLWALLTLPSPPIELVGEPRLAEIVAGGTPAPEGGSFDRFELAGRAVPAAVNAKGWTAFFAALLRSEAEEAIFLSRGAAIERVVAVGDKMPTGETVAGFTEHPAPALDEAGAIAFAATLTGGKAAVGVFVKRAGRFDTVALSGAPAPGISGATLVDFDAPLLNGRGDIAFLAQLRRGRETLEGIFVWRDGVLRKLVVAGDPSPGGGNFASFGTPALNNAGVLAFPAVVERGAVLGGIYVVDPQGIRLVVGAGDRSPAGGIFAKFSERIGLSDAGAVAFGAQLRQAPTQSGVFVAAQDQIRAVATLGAAAPEGGRFSSFGLWPAMAPDGAVAFFAALDEGPAPVGMFLGRESELRRIAGVGESLPGGARLISFALYPTLAIGPGERLSFAATVERDGVVGPALWSWGPPPVR